MDVAELDRMVERREWTDSTVHQAFRAAGDYVLYSWKPDSIVRLFKRFYSDGRIKQKGLVIANGEGFIGPHYRFAEDGTRSIDHSNRLFEFTLDELALCLRSHDIPVLYRPGPNGVQTSIVMQLTDEGPRWRVSSLRRSGLVEDLTIDGTNGALLAQTTRNAPEDG